MNESQWMKIVIQDPSLVIRECHECLGFLLCTDSEILVVDAFERALNHCVSLTLCLKYMFVQIDAFTFILLPLITTFRGTSFAIFCITCFSSMRQYILGLKPTNSVIRCPLCSSLKIGPGSFLLKLRKDESEGNLLLPTHCS